jgi:hypothetical protein
MAPTAPTARLNFQPRNPDCRAGAGDLFGRAEVERQARVWYLEAF